MLRSGDTSPSSNGQDKSLSSSRCGFDSRRGQSFSIEERGSNPRADRFDKRTLQRFLVDGRAPGHAEWNRYRRSADRSRPHRSHTSESAQARPCAESPWCLPRARLHRPACLGRSGEAVPRGRSTRHDGVSRIDQTRAASAAARTARCRDCGAGVGWRAVFGRASRRAVCESATRRCVAETMDAAADTR